MNEMEKNEMKDNHKKNNRNFSLLTGFLVICVAVLCVGTVWVYAGYAGSGTINPTDYPPVAYDDEYTISVEIPRVYVKLDVLKNDVDVLGRPLSVLTISQPLYGSAMRVDGSVYYMPPESRGVIDSFSYVATNGICASNEGAVTIWVV